ncbi:MAG: recombinase family protein [Clostridia bacterium]
MNEWYAKDTSNKIRNTFKARMKDGKRCSGSIPYGFYRKADDKNTLYVDEEPAKIVKLIFQMIIDGYGVKGIADFLSTQNILIPSAYAKKYRPENNHSGNIFNPYKWSSTTVSYILEKREYMGHTVLGKTVCDNFKTKKRRKATEDELIIFKNTHQSIVSEETWHNAQRLKKKIRRTVLNQPRSHLLSGILYCSDCGARMTYRSPDATHRKNSKTYDSDSAFVCGNYRSLHNKCSMHFVKSSATESLILKSINDVVGFVLENETEFISQVKNISNSHQEQLLKSNKAELKTSKARLCELDELIKKLYEANAIGKLPDNHFEKLLADYDAEYTELSKNCSELEVNLQEFTQEKHKTKNFISLVKKYKQIENLTPTILNEFVEKIIIYEATGGRTKFRQQKIDIHFNFIGDFEISKIVSKPKEIKDENIGIILKAIHHNYNG